MKNFFFFVLGISLLSACSTQTEKCTDVNQAKIYQGYTVTFKANDAETSVSAEYRFGGITGTTLELVGNCAIKHDTIGALSKSSLSSVLGTSYGGSKASYIAANTFTFTNSEGKTFTNSITNPNIVTVTSPPSTLNKASSLTLNFTPAVGTKESVSVYVSLKSPPSGSGTTSVSESTDTAGATSVTFSAAKLAELATVGDVYIYAERTFSKDLDQASTDQGGHMYYYYYSDRATATLTN